jgi:ABC-2 type transport system ATP-binding protein
VVEEKTALMKKLGKKRQVLHLAEPLTALPAGLDEWALTLKTDGREIEYSFDAQSGRTGVSSLLRKLTDLGVAFRDIDTHSSSLEDIFVDLVHEKA